MNQGLPHIYTACTDAAGSHEGGPGQNCCRPNSEANEFAAHRGPYRPTRHQTSGALALVALVEVVESATQATCG